MDQLEEAKDPSDKEEKIPGVEKAAPQAFLGRHISTCALTPQISVV